MNFIKKKIYQMLFSRLNGKKFQKEFLVNKIWNIPQKSGKSWKFPLLLF